jgi:hypothetical protein
VLQHDEAHYVGHAADHAHHRAVQSLGHRTGFFDFFDERIVIFGIVHAGGEAPGGELRNCDIRLVAQLARGVDSALAGIGVRAKIAAVGTRRHLAFDAADC